MSDLLNRPWSHHLVQLRARATRLRPAMADGAVGRLVDDALASCADLLDSFGRVQLKCEHLLDEARTAMQAQKQLFEIVPCPSLITDRRSTILQANSAASRLFNLASRRLAGRDLLLYTHHREAFLRLLANLPHGDNVVHVSLIIRPRERRPIETTATVSAVPPESSGAWVWFFSMPHSLPLADVEPIGDDAASDMSPSVEPAAAAVTLAAPRSSRSDQ